MIRTKYRILWLEGNVIVSLGPQGVTLDRLAGCSLRATIAGRIGTTLDPLHLGSAMSMQGGWPSWPS